MSRQNQGYKMPSFNEKINLKRYYQNLHEAATFFENYFVNRIVTYYTLNRKVNVYFSKSNFMHLCGIKYKSGSISFFNDCLYHNISVDEISIKNDGTTIQKLQVLGAISEIIGMYVRLTGKGQFLHLDFDYSLRTNKQILALTLTGSQHKTVLNSLLGLKFKSIFPVGEPVVAIISKKYNSDKITIYYKEDTISTDDLT